MRIDECIERFERVSTALRERMKNKNVPDVIYSIIADDMYQAAEWLKEYKIIAERGGRLIDRAELFNVLATVKAPPEANEYKAEVYKTIQELPGIFEEVKK